MQDEQMLEQASLDLQTTQTEAEQAEMYAEIDAMLVCPNCEDSLSCQCGDVCGLWKCHDCNQVFTVAELAAIYYGETV